MIGSKPLADLFERACLAELSALKIGNTHIWDAGKGNIATFATAAALAKAPLCRRGASVGERILSAAEAVKPLGENVNLGIILLAAPILKTAQTTDNCARQALKATLRGLTIEDAERTFQAIRLLNPSGLRRRVRRGNVFARPSEDLRRVMALAAKTDLIAAEYATGFPQVFAGSEFIGEKHRNNRPLSETLARLHLRFVAMGDSHLAKSVSVKAAKTARSLALRLISRLEAGRFSLKPLLAADKKLKQLGYNPGASADLVVASALVAFIRWRW